MTAKRPRRTLADRNRDAITNTAPPAPAPALEPVATGTAKAAPAPRARRQSAPPPLPPAAGEGSPRPVTVWIDDATWGRAKTAYLLDDEDGSWGDWVAAQIAARAADPTSLDHLDTADGQGGGRRGRTVWLTPAALDQVRAATRALALAGRSASRSAIIAGALAAAVREAGGTALPINTGRLPGGPKPRS